MRLCSCIVTVECHFVCKVRRRDGVRSGGKAHFPSYGADSIIQPLQQHASHLKQGARVFQQLHISHLLVPSFLVIAHALAHDSRCKLYQAKWC